MTCHQEDTVDQQKIIHILFSQTYQQLCSLWKSLHHSPYLCCTDRLLDKCVINDFVDICWYVQCSVNTFKARGKKVLKRFELWFNLSNLVWVISLHWDIFCSLGIVNWNRAKDSYRMHLSMNQLNLPWFCWLIIVFCIRSYTPHYTIIWHTIRSYDIYVYIYMSYM